MKSNPFLGDWGAIVTTWKKEKFVKVGHKVVATSEDVIYDKIPSTRLYRTKNLSKLILEMHPDVCKVFLYILTKINKADFVELNLTEMSENCLFYDKKNKLLNGRNKIFQAIKELVNKNVLAVKQEKYQTYWLNPFYIFGTNRITFLNKEKSLKTQDAEGNVVDYNQETNEDILESAKNAKI